MNVDRIFDILADTDRCLNPCYFGYYGYMRSQIKRDWIYVLNKLKEFRFIRYNHMIYTSGNIRYVFHPRSDIDFLISVIEKINNGYRISKKDILRAKKLCIIIAYMLCFS